jgi:hypothetical protein
VLGENDRIATDPLRPDFARIRALLLLLAQISPDATVATQVVNLDVKLMHRVERFADGSIQRIAMREA